MVVSDEELRDLDRLFNKVKGQDLPKVAIWNSFVACLNASPSLQDRPDEY